MQTGCVGCDSGQLQSNNYGVSRLQNQKMSKASGSIIYEYDQQPERGAAVDILPGVKWVRLPLPFTLSHINTWLLRDGEGWVYSANNLQTIGTGLRNYHEVFGRLPPATFHGKDGKPLYSWRVVLLPFIEQDPLYKQFKRDEPWDGPHNKSLLHKMPQCYASDWGGQSDRTHYQVFVGPGTAFEREGLAWKDFPDGLAVLPGFRDHWR